MAELTAEDLSLYARGRITDDDAAQDAVDSALAAARRYCGWHVCPVREDDEITIDGPGGHLLTLPTLNLLAVTALSEDGTEMNVTELDVSITGSVQKQPRACWTERPGGITVTIDHGYTEAEAADWRRAVLQLADSMAAESTGQRESADLTSKKVDDVEYQWAGGIISTDQRLASMFSAYRILPSP